MGIMQTLMVQVCAATNSDLIIRQNSDGEFIMAIGGEDCFLFSTKEQVCKFLRHMLAKAKGVVVNKQPLNRCGGKLYNGPDKRFTRCQECGSIDYEANEGDLCQERVQL